MIFEELNEATRRFMVDEFEAEERGGSPFRGKGLTPAGLVVVPDLIRQAILQGNNDTLADSLCTWDYWLRFDRIGRRVNLEHAAKRLGQSEFSTWYVRGLARKLLEEGIQSCQIYRAGEPKGEPAECSTHEGQIVSVQEVYEGHRAHYWPEPGRHDVLSIPFNPFCHHLIRRIAE